MSDILYERDFYAWALRNAELIREGRFTEMDAEHVAEELETMGRSERRALVSRLAVLLAHLLKWQHQPAHRSASWRNTIEVQRDDVSELLEESSSLRQAADDVMTRAYRKALRLAERETGLGREHFPAACPFTLEQTLDPDFWPG